MTARGFGPSYGSRLCSLWVRIYTRRLPEAASTERREEMASDLWEHRRHALESGHGPTRHTIDVLARAAGGIPADLSWRRSVLRTNRRRNKGATMANDHSYSFAELALAALAGLGAATPFPFVILLGTALFEGPGLVDVLWILGAITLAGLLLAGLVLRLQGGRPLLSTALLVVGSAAPSLAWFWLPPVYLLTVLIAVLALTTIRDRPMLERVAI